MRSNPRAARSEGGRGTRKRGRLVRDKRCGTRELGHPKSYRSSYSIGRLLREKDAELETRDYHARGTGERGRLRRGSGGEWCGATTGGPAR